MITTIIGQGNKVWFMRNHEPAESFSPTQGEWRVLRIWLNNEVSPIYRDEQTWTCQPLFSGPGGFIAQKLIIH